MNLFTDPRYQHHDEAGNPITGHAELEALCADIESRRVGLAVVSSPDGRHHAHVSTVFMVEMPDFYEPKGGPYEMLVQRLDHPDAHPGEAMPLGGRFPTREAAAEAHEEMVATLAKPDVLATFADAAVVAALAALEGE